MSKLLKNLIKEKFNGELPEWKERTLGDIRVCCIEDKENYYYHNENSDVIYVEAKEGNGQLYCYGCGRKIKVKLERVSVQYRKFSSPGGKIDIKYKYIPYCPECEGYESQK